MKPNFIVILIDDLRYDEFGAGGHPYMQTPNVDRLASEGALFERAFHTTPICSPNRASIVTGQYASRHGIIDNVARDAMSHRLPNYHLELQKRGYETAHIGKWHMGNDGMPRPGYDTWVSYDGHGKIVDPTLNHDGRYVEHKGYITDIMNELAVDFLERKRAKPFSLFFAHKAVHPDAAAGRGRHVRHLRPTAATSRPSVIATSTATRSSRRSPNMLPAADVIRQKPAWAECLGLKESERARAILAALACGRAGGDPAARANDGVGRRRDRRHPRDAGAAGQARRHVHRLPRRQRLFLRRACARSRAPLRVRGRHPVAVSRPLPAQGEGGNEAARARHLPGHRADADRARRRQAGAADPGAIAAAARLQAPASVPDGASRSSSSTGPSRRCPGSSA